MKVLQINMQDTLIRMLMSNPGTRTLGNTEFRQLCSEGRLLLIEARRLPGEVITWEENCVVLLVRDIVTGEYYKYYM
jgi:hypothetical protein